MYCCGVPRPRLVVLLLLFSEPDWQRLVGVEGPAYSTGRGAVGKEASQITAWATAIVGCVEQLHPHVPNSTELGRTRQLPLGFCTWTSWTRPGGNPAPWFQPRLWHSLPAPCHGRVIAEALKTLEHLQRSGCQASSRGSEGFEGVFEGPVARILGRQRAKSSEPEKPQETSNPLCFHIFHSLLNLLGWGRPGRLQGRDLSEHTQTHNIGWLGQMVLLHPRPHLEAALLLLLQCATWKKTGAMRRYAGFPRVLLRGLWLDPEPGKGAHPQPPCR